MARSTAPADASGMTLRRRQTVIFRRPYSNPDHDPAKDGTRAGAVLNCTLATTWLR